MNYKIFQVYYDKKQLDLLDSEFTAFDNTENSRPELREYHIFKLAEASNYTNDLDAWGFVSPLWKHKVRVYPKDFIAWIDSNPGYDVYHINYSRMQEAIAFNVWEQAEWYHKGISDVTKKVLSKMGIDVDFTQMPMSKDTYCMCSYFVATKEFWKNYIAFLDKFYDVANSSEELKSAVFGNSANYRKDTSIGYFPFIVERLFSTYLSVHKQNYKIAYYPYDYSCYKKDIHNLSDLLDGIGSVKHFSMQSGDEDLFEVWKKMRSIFLKKYSGAMGYELEEFSNLK